MLYTARPIHTATNGYQFGVTKKYFPSAIV